MSGESDLRRIEDVDGAALTYAEVKAIASGNPLVIEKASIDAEVARLSRLQAQHHETQFKLRQRMRHLTDELPRLEKRLEALGEDLNRRQDTRGDLFVIDLGGERIRDRGIAGELINRHAARMPGSGTERLVGHLAGFELYVADAFMGGPQILIKGAGTYSANVSDSAHGTIRSIEHAIQQMNEVVSSAEQQIQETRKRIADLGTQCGQTFEYCGRLSELMRRQAEIADALDLTKNQGSSQLGTEAPAQASEEAEASAMTLREMGFCEFEY
jgi:TolA-binding protein